MKKLLTLAALVAAISLLIATWPAEPARAAVGMRPGMMRDLMLPQTAASVATGFTADRLNKFGTAPGCPVAGYYYYDTTADVIKVCNNALSAVGVGGATVASFGANCLVLAPTATTLSCSDVTNAAGVSVTIGNSAQFLAQPGTGTAPGVSFVGNLTTGLVASGGSLYLVTPNVNVNFNNGTSVTSTLATGTGLFTAYGSGIAVAGQGLASIRAVTSQRNETTTADANVLTLTPPAAVGTYRVSVNISVSSATAGVIAWTLSWTDSNGNAQANIAMPLFQLGTAAPNTTFTTSVAGNYTGTSTIDINNAAAAIVVKWVGGGTTAAKMSATIERIQ